MLLQRRFTHLFKAHQQKLAETQQDDKPDLWMIRGAWLARFCQERLEAARQQVSVLEGEVLKSLDAGASAEDED